MLDDHLLRWLPDFAARIAARTAHPFYAALAHLTVVWCRSFRDLLADTPRLTARYGGRLSLRQAPAAGRPWWPDRRPAAAC